MKRRGLTLLELLVVMAIILILMGALAQSLAGLRHGAQTVKCMTNLRVVATDFQFFANDSLSEDRGSSDLLPPTLFHMLDFVEKEYRVASFWEGSIRPQKMDPSTDPMICPVSELPLERIPDRRCENGAITPYENVSYSFNRRLHEQTFIYAGRYLPQRDTRVHSRILETPTVPIAFDVDGSPQANPDGRAPYFTAPPVPGHQDYYSDGRWWFPSFRHRGKMNVAFVGGHLLSSRDPVKEAGWNWTYQPDPIRELQP